MISKLFIQIKRHKFISGIAFLLIIGVGYWGFGKFFGENGVVRYATAQVQNGTFIVSIFGSGQVSASDQVDIKPKVSGELTALYVTMGQEVKIGQLLAVIDPRAARRTVNEAEISLESAKIDLEELLSPPDVQSLLQAKNALAQAERDLEKARRDYDNIDDDVESTLASAYEDGYSDVSTAFFKLATYMVDLRDVAGTEQSEQEYIGGYRLILGENSFLIQKYINDYYQAKDLYYKNFAFFREVFRDSNRDKIYKLLEDTLKTTKAISRAQESARHMYDAIVLVSYKQLNVSSQVDKMNALNLYPPSKRLKMM